MSELTPEQLKRAEAMAASFADLIRQGRTPPTFEEYQETVSAEVVEVYTVAFKQAETLAAGEWGFGPLSNKRLSRAAWQELPLPEQARFIREGGSVYEPELPDLSAAETVTGGKGQTLTRGEFHALTPQQQSNFCLAK